MILGITKESACFLHLKTGPRIAVTCDDMKTPEYKKGETIENCTCTNADHF